MADESTAKIVVFCKDNTELRMHENHIFFLPVNILTVLSTSFLGRTTHYRVSWSQYYYGHSLDSNACLDHLRIVHAGVYLRFLVVVSLQLLPPYHQLDPPACSTTVDGEEEWIGVIKICVQMECLSVVLKQCRT